MSISFLGNVFVGVGGGYLGVHQVGLLGALSSYDGRHSFSVRRKIE